MIVFLIYPYGVQAHWQRSKFFNSSQLFSWLFPIVDMDLEKIIALIISNYSCDYCELLNIIILFVLDYSHCFHPIMIIENNLK